MDELNPPAIIRSADAATELVARARRQHAAIVQDEKLTLARAVDLGKTLIKLKEACSRDFLAKLGEVGVAQQRASEYMRLAKVPAPVLSEFESIREAVRALPVESSPVQPPPTVPSPLRCPDCQRTGQKRDCPKCFAIRAQAEKDAAKAAMKASTTAPAATPAEEEEKDPRLDESQYFHQRSFNGYLDKARKELEKGMLNLKLDESQVLKQAKRQLIELKIDVAKELKRGVQESLF